MADSEKEVGVLGALKEVCLARILDQVMKLHKAQSMISKRPTGSESISLIIVETYAVQTSR